MRRRCRFVGERRLEALDSLEMVSALGRDKPERNAGPHRRNAVSGSERLVQDLYELFLRRGDVVREPELELRVRKTEFPVVDVPDVTAGLQILDGHAELLRQLSQGLDGGCARARLDARDVGVRNPRGREIPLRKTTLKSETLEARAYALGRTALGHADPDH